MELTMTTDPNLPLIIFFVATAIAITSAHIGLIRLIGNAASDAVAAIAREKSGVLIVVEFSLVILICAPLPIATRLLASPGTDYFLYANWVAPVVTLILAVVDLGLATWKRRANPPGGFYYVVVILLIVVSVGLLYAKCGAHLSSASLFFFALGLPLFVIAAQFLKSALRLADYAP